MLDIPPSRLVVCVYCMDRLDSNARGTWRRATGWLPIKRGSQNKQGTNMLALPQLHYEWACDACIAKRKAGLPPGQLSLFKAAGEP